MSLFDKFRDVAAGVEELAEIGIMPFGAAIEEISSPTEGVVDGHSVILAGTNNYLGLTFDPECVQAGRRALLEL